MLQFFNLIFPEFQPPSLHFVLCYKKAGFKGNVGRSVRVQTHAFSVGWPSESLWTFNPCLSLLGLVGDGQREQHRLFRFQEHSRAWERVLRLPHTQPEVIGVAFHRMQRMAVIYLVDRWSRGQNRLKVHTTHSSEPYCVTGKRPRQYTLCPV